MRFDCLSSPDTDSPPPLGPPRVSWRLALQSIVGFWAFYFLFGTLRAAIEDEGGQIEMMQRRLLVTLLGMGLVFLLALLFRRLEGRPMWLLVLVAFLAAIPISLAYGVLNYTVFYIVAPLDMDAPAMATPSQTHLQAAMSHVHYALNWYFFVVAWAVLYIALSYAERVRHAERSAAYFRAAAQAAQLRALRYQINPHFLFNTLNSLSTLVLGGRTDEAERMIITLSAFFRASLVDDPALDVALAEEIRLQRLYLDIEQTRFPERLRVRIDIPRELETAAIPGFILQPLVENAVKHGVARSAGPVTILLQARARDGRLTLIVENDGAPAAGGTAGTGVGLRNVQDRLIARFQDHAAFAAEALADGGFRVSLLLPLRPIEAPSR